MIFMARNKFTDLNILNLASSALGVVLLAVLLSMEFVSYQKTALLDEINNTNYSENLSELANIPKVTSFLFLSATTVYLVITWYQIYLTSSDSDATEEDIQTSYRNFIAILFFIIGSIINYQTSNRNANVNAQVQVPEEEFL